MKKSAMTIVGIFACLVSFGVGQAAGQSSPKDDWRIDYHIKDINRYKKQVDEWNPADSYFPSVKSNDDYASVAISKEYQAEWLKKYNLTSNSKLDAALASLKESLYKRYPEHKLNPQAFPHRNAAEEKMMVSELKLPGAKVFRAGFEQASWLIDTNEFGIPRARFKRGLIYGRNPNNEDPFCRVWYVNVIQDYAGGGTYAAAYARYLNRSIVACPAGQ